MHATSIKHHLGISGTLSVSDTTKQRAAYNGLSLMRAGWNNYAIQQPALLNVANDQNSFTRHELRRFTDFIHQPVRTTLLEAGIKDEGAIEAFQGFLRHAATGKVLPSIKSVMGSCKIHGDSCPGIGCDEHVEIEQQIKDDMDRREKAETGDDIIPGFSFDQDQGVFVLPLSPNKNKHPLRKHLHECLAAADIQVDEDQRETRLSPQELKAVLKHATAVQQAGQILMDVNNAAKQERIDNAIANIERHAGKLAIQRGVRESLYGAVDPKVRIEYIAQATSAFSPIFKAPVLEEAWRHYHPYNKKDSPVPQVNADLVIMEEVLAHYQSKPVTSHEVADALVHEFYPTLSFLKETADLLDLTEADKVLSNPDISDVSMREDLLPAEQQATLKLLRQTTHQNGSFLEQGKNVAWNVTAGFVNDLTAFYREHPKKAIAATICISALTIYLKSLYNVGINASMDPSFLEAGAGAVALDGSIIPVAVQGEVVTENQVCHMDLNVIGMYKHCLTNVYVTQPAQQTMFGLQDAITSAGHYAGIFIDQGAEFFKAPKTTIEWLADKYTTANLVQDLTHAGFWSTMGYSGWKHGYKDMPRLVRFLSPLAEWSQAGAIRSLEITGVRKNLRLHERLMELSSVSRAVPVIPTQDNAGSSFETAESLTDAAEARFALEGTLPKAIKTAMLDMKIGGIRQQFEISAKNLMPTLRALERFDAVVEHLAPQIGITPKQSWQQTYLRHEIQAATEALRKFQQDGDEATLKKALPAPLENVMAAQMRHQGNSSVMMSTFGREASPSEEASLNSLGGQRHWKQRTKANAAIYKSSPSFKQGAFVAGTGLWSCIVSSYRTAREGLRSLPNKKLWTSAIASICTTAAAIDINGGVKNLGASFNQAADSVSYATSEALSAAVTTASFLIFNVGQDIVQNHIAIAAVLLMGGATAKFIAKPTIAPVLDTKDALRKGVGQLSWKKLYGRGAVKKQAEAPDALPSPEL